MRLWDLIRLPSTWGHVSAEAGLFLGRCSVAVSDKRLKTSTKLRGKAFNSRHLSAMLRLNALKLLTGYPGISSLGASAVDGIS